MILGCKWSGEALRQGGEPGDTWTEEGRIAAVAGVVALREYVTQPNDHQAFGAFVVPGAGNGGFRGRELTKRRLAREHAADIIGLTGTIANAVIIDDALDEAGVRHELLLSPGLRYEMPGLAPRHATPGVLDECFVKGVVPIIGGGSGRLNQSTDSAVIDHAVAYHNEFDEPIQVFKATEFGGVYTADPRLMVEGDKPPQLLRRVSVATMRRYGWYAIDSACMDTITTHRVPMLLHGLTTPLVDALNGNGTLVLPDEHELTIAADGQLLLV